MPPFHDHDKKQNQSKAAADSPHFQQEGIASFKAPPFSVTAEPVSQKKEENEEKGFALQKKENAFTGEDTPPNPNEHILTTLQRKHNANRPPVQQYAPFKPFQKKETPNKPQNSLPNEIQAKMEHSMGHDFSDVNIHKESSQATDAGALAYAQGNDIHFAPGQFKPDTTSGQELIGHELAHVVQQREGRVQPTKVLGKGMAVNDDPSLENEADAMGRKAARGEVGQYKSAALGMRSSLRTMQAKGAVMQRAVDTWGGSWSTEEYDLIEPTSPEGLRGIYNVLEFEPNPNVDAELIGLSQSVRSIKKNNVYYVNADPFYEGRAIDSSEAQPTSDPDSIGATDEGTHIDRIKNRNNPIYGSDVAAPGNTLENTPLDNNSTSDPTVVGSRRVNPDANASYQLGYRYSNSSGDHIESAKLSDRPTRNNASVNSEHVFETTALALKGNQQDMYYGSVQWGWRTNTKGEFNEIPLKVVSQGVPSSTFLKAAEKWNNSQSSTGADTLDLPLVDVQLTTAPILQQLPADFIGPPYTIPVGTRVQILERGQSPSTNGRLKIIDGPNTNTEIDVRPEDLNNLRDER